MLQRYLSCIAFAFLLGVSFHYAAEGEPEKSLTVEQMLDLLDKHHELHKELEENGFTVREQEEIKAKMDELMSQIIGARLSGKLHLRSIREPSTEGGDYKLLFHFTRTKKVKLSRKDAKRFKKKYKEVTLYHLNIRAELPKDKILDYAQGTEVEVGMVLRKVDNKTPLYYHFWNTK